MKPRGRIMILLVLATMLFWLLLDAADVRLAVLEGLNLCVRSVIPSLFPFLVLSSLLISLGLGEFLSSPFSGLMSLYRIDGAGGSALLLGLIGGYPAGPRTAAELYRNHLLTRDEANRLLTFCNNSNPAFLISVLGSGVFGSVRTGIWLWLIHLLSALLTGLFLGRGHAAPSLKERRLPPARAVRLPSAFVGAVQSGLTAILSICAFVVFFYVLALPLRGLSGTLGAAAAGSVELFSATPMLANSRTGFLLASALAGWGGLSVHCQTLAVLEGSGLDAWNCVKGKALQGGLSLLLAWAVAFRLWP